MTNMRFALLGPALLAGATLSVAAFAAEIRERVPLRIAQNAESPDGENPDAGAQPAEEQAAPPAEEGEPKKQRRRREAAPEGQAAPDGNEQPERRARGKRPDPAQEAPDAGAAEAEAQRQEAERAARQQQEEAEKAAAAAAKAQQDEEAAKAAAAAKAQQDEEAAKAAAAAKAQQDEEAAKAAAAAKAQQDEEAAKAAAAAKAQQDDEAAKAAATKTQQQLDAEKADAANQQQPDAGKAAPKAASPQAAPLADGETKRRALKGRDEPAPAARGDGPPAGAPPSASNEAKDLPPEMRPKRLFRPSNEKQAVEQLKQEGVRADQEFEKAKREAATEPQASGDGKRGAAAPAGNAAGFEQVRKQRRQRVEDGGQRAVIEEPGKRSIIIEKDRTFVRHDETQRFSRSGKRNTARASEGRQHAFGVSGVRRCGNPEP